MTETEEILLTGLDRPRTFRELAALFPELPVSALLKSLSAAGVITRGPARQRQLFGKQPDQWRRAAGIKPRTLKRIEQSITSRFAPPRKS